MGPVSKAYGRPPELPLAIALARCCGKPVGSCPAPATGHACGMRDTRRRQAAMSAM